MSVSNELKRFYQDLQQWIDAGMPENRVFNEGSAVCKSLDEWSKYLFYSGIDAGGLREENTDLFFDVTGEDCFPFNSSDVEFVKEHRGLSFYKNPKRLEFIEGVASGRIKITKPPKGDRDTPNLTGFDEWWAKKEYDKQLSSLYPVMRKRIKSSMRDAYEAGSASRGLLAR